MISELEVIGRRLKAIRFAFSDCSQRDWAQKHGFKVTQYNNWENGVRRIPLEAAGLLADQHGLTLDYIYRGREDALGHLVKSQLNSQRRG